MSETAIKHSSRTRWRDIALAALICAVFGLSLAPFLRKFEFSNGGENAVVASVQEMYRGGPWLVPTLHEEQRTKKPPLATWLSALAARAETAAKFSDPDPATRHAAFVDFAWQVRWPSLVAMCGVLMGTYVLGALIGGTRLGIVSALVCASSFFWLRNARLATTDNHLALWVTVANCFLAAAVLERRWWLGLIGGGAALGLAMMSKGPVALLQTVLSVVAFTGWRYVRVPMASGEYAVRHGPRRLFAPLFIGLALFALIGLSWYALVMWKNPAVWEQWKIELTREGATGLEPSKWYAYIYLLGNMVPWTFFMIVGLVGSTIMAFARNLPPDERGSRIVLALFLLIVPIVTMSFFRDREIRYLIPLLAPTSIIAAWGLVEWLEGVSRPRGARLMVAVFHWLPMFVAAVGLPLVGSPLMAARWIGDDPWYSLRYGVIAAEVLGLLTVAAIVCQRRWRVWGIVVGTAVVMMAWNVVLNDGYRRGREGRSELRPLAELILATHPDAKVYSYRADRPARHAPIDLSIYLNRVVEPVADPAEMSGTTDPRVFLVRQKHSTPLADPSILAPSAGGPWQLLATTPVDDAIWYAFTSVP